MGAPLGSGRSTARMGISRSSRDKHSATGAAPSPYRKKRQHEAGRQPAMTKLGARRIHPVRTRGGNLKHRALRLESGNYAWGSEHTTRKTLVKGCVVQIDAAPFRQWYEAHYGQAVVK